MTRFLVFAFTLLLVLFALFNLGVELAGLQTDLGPLVGWQEGRQGLPGAYVLGTWALEALALATLFLLVHSRGGSPWFDGLLSGWIAWVFRGPLLVMTAVGFAGEAPGPWWRLTSRWFVLYTLSGLLLAAVARLVTRGSGETAPEEGAGEGEEEGGVRPVPSAPANPPLPPPEEDADTDREESP